MSVTLDNQNNSYNKANQTDFMHALMECSSELKEQVLLLLKDVVCADDVDLDDKEMEEMASAMFKTGWLHVVFYSTHNSGIEIHEFTVPDRYEFTVPDQ